MIQIDGLARDQFDRALRAGRLPFLRSLLRRRGYTQRTFYSGLPASTPAVQGELYYGVPTAVPAFSFLDRRAGGIGMMMYPEWAKRIETDLSEQNEGLLRGGSSWSNIYTGGAAQEESHFCGASVGAGDLWRTVKFPLLAALAVLHLDALLRVVGLFALELVIGLWDALHGVFKQGRNWRREFVFLFARVAVCIGLREFVTLGAAIDVARGLPVVHVNFLGYDEQSHRRGPSSAFAHWTLREIDRCIRRLYRAAHRSGRRDYDVWIFSDHGQTRARQAAQLVPGGLEGLVRRHWATVAPDDDAHPPTRAQVRPSPGHWLGGPGNSRRTERLQAGVALSVFEKEEFAVAALGPVGHIYFGRDPGTDGARRLAAALVREGVPGVLLRREDGGVDWLEAGGEHQLPEHFALLEVASELQAALARDLVALAHNPHAGNLVALGWAPGGVRWTFASENGAHAGPSPEEVLGFALLPPSTWLPAGTEHFIRPAALRRAALHLLGRDRAVRSARPGSKVEKPPPTVPLRIATYNVHGCLGTDGRIAPQRIARVLEQLDADIIALQELDLGRARTRSEDQAALIAETLGYHLCFCPVVTHADGRYGHAVLARSPLTLRQQARLPGGRWPGEPRDAVWVECAVHGRTVQVVATHLGLGLDERNRQVDALINGAWLGRIDAGNPVVLCGDFNLPPGSQAYCALSARLRDVQAHAPAHVALRTFPSLWPLRRIDHIFVSAHFAIRAVQVPRDALTVVASDHLPLVTDLDLR